MQHSRLIDRIKHIGVALAFVLYPLLAGFAFAVHPNLFNLSVTQSVSARIAEFHGNPLLHFGHVLMVAAVPLLVVIAAHFIQLLSPRGGWWGLVGGCLAVAGAVILALDKGALCLVVSAFDTLPEATFQQLRPGIEAMFQYRGWLWLLHLLPLLPLGFIVQTLALVAFKVIPRRQSIPMLVGSVLMANPDIDLIGLIATICLALGFWPYALGLFQAGAAQRSNLSLSGGGRMG